MTTNDLDKLRADVSDILGALEEQLQLMAAEGPQEAHSAAVLMRHSCHEAWEKFDRIEQILDSQRMAE